MSANDTIINFDSKREDDNKINKKQKSKKKKHTHKTVLNNLNIKCPCSQIFARLHKRVNGEINECCLSNILTISLCEENKLKIFIEM